MKTVRKGNYLFAVYPPPLFQSLCVSYDEGPRVIFSQKLGEAILDTGRFQPPLAGADLERAASVGKVCQALLTRYNDFPETKQPLVIGAVRFFLMHYDIIPDNKPESGLSDDVALVNYVLQELGVNDMFIE